MPNWVYNSMMIGGDEAKLTELLTKWETPPKDDEREEFSFQNIIPRPEDQGDNWYDWNCSNWGTKWDACEPETYWDNDSLEIKFSTAWSQPEPIFVAIGDICKANGLSLTIYFEEEQGWGGAWKLEEDGTWDMTEWDIPESHAEYEALGRECVCGWDEFRFDDCPKEEEAA
jgi:hypothetical protein